MGEAKEICPASRSKKSPATMVKSKTSFNSRSSTETFDPNPTRSEGRLSTIDLGELGLPLGEVGHASLDELLAFQSRFVFGVLPQVPELHSLPDALRKLPGQLVIEAAHLIVDLVANLVQHDMVTLLTRSGLPSGGRKGTPPVVGRGRSIPRV